QLREMLLRFKLKGGAGTNNNVRALPQKKAPTSRAGWGESPEQPQKKSSGTKAIALDDEEFGKY
ncbi:MAG: hypothetical protein R6V33_12225, partial [Pelovirga sp.]